MNNCKEIGLTLGTSPKSPADALTSWEHPGPRPPAPGLRPPAGSSPPWQHLGNLGPAVAEHLVGLTDDAVLLLSPAGLLHLGVEVVVPALTALLPQPALQVLGNQCPLLRAVLLDQLDDLGKGLCEARGTRPSLTAPTQHPPSTYVSSHRVSKRASWTPLPTPRTASPSLDPLGWVKPTVCKALADSYLLILLFGPWPLDEVWIQDPQPPVLALLVGAVLGREQEPVRIPRTAALDTG